MALDYFLYIHGIPGASRDARHQGQIEILNWAWGTGFAPTASAAAVAAPETLPPLDTKGFCVWKPIDKASPKLLYACASRQTLSKAVFTARRAGDVREEAFRFTLHEVQVTAFDVSASSGESPVEQISLGFSRLEFDVVDISEMGERAGAVRSGWDFAKDESC